MSNDILVLSVKLPINYLIILIAVLCLIGQVLCQNEATLKQPPYIETNTYTLRKTFAWVVSLSATINFMQNYTSANIIPQVANSLAPLYTFTPLDLILHAIDRQHSADLLYPRLSICLHVGGEQLHVCINRHRIRRPRLFSISIRADLYLFFTLRPTITLSNQYYQMRYMNPLPFLCGGI
jgi:hypothetical protein